MLIYRIVSYRILTHAGPSTRNALPDNVRAVADPVKFRKPLKSRYFYLSLMSRLRLFLYLLCMPHRFLCLNGDRYRIAVPSLYHMKFHGKTWKISHVPHGITCGINPGPIFCRIANFLMMMMMMMMMIIINDRFRGPVRAVNCLCVCVCVCVRVCVCVGTITFA